MTEVADPYYDPYGMALYHHPYDAYRVLRDAAPLYYSERHDFYALSRYDDIKDALKDSARLINGHGIALDQIKSNYQFPPGTLVYEDEPVHGPRRALLARIFTPKAMAALEPQIREYCARTLDLFQGQPGFDFAKDVGDKVPMRVICMMLGIPESDQDELKRKLDRILEQEPGEKWEIATDAFSGEAFADYVDWRTRNPSDDLMTQLIFADFEDEEGVARRLTRPELLSYINILAAAGNETTGLLIGWLGKLLGDHPDQRRRLVENPVLIASAVDEALRFEPSTQVNARYVFEDVTYHGQTLPAGSALLLLFGSGNRDDRVFGDPDVFDVGRNEKRHLTFSHGIHTCLGAALARLEGRILVEEALKRFPDWVVLEDEAVMGNGNVAVRGWESMPVRFG